jgi:hypothetical protein
MIESVASNLICCPCCGSSLGVFSEEDRHESRYAVRHPLRTVKRMTVDGPTSVVIEESVVKFSTQNFEKLHVRLDRAVRELGEFCEGQVVAATGELPLRKPKTGLMRDPGLFPVAKPTSEPASTFGHTKRRILR